MPNEWPPAQSDTRKSLQEQLEGIEVKDPAAVPVSEAQAKPGEFESKETKKRRKRGQGGGTDSYTGDAKYTVPALAEASAVSYEGDAKYPVPAVIETPKEKREALRVALADVINLPDRSEENIHSIHDAPKKSVAEAERSAVAQKETAYLSAYKELEQKRTLWNRLMGGRDLAAEAEYVDGLKKEYDEARVTYANALTTSADERLSGKGADKERKDKVLDRYNRLVRFNEVVKPTIEKKLVARQEALDARGRNALSKALGWSAEANKKLEQKYGKNGARSLRAAASAIIITGGMAGLTVAGVVAPMGIAALAGYGTFKFGRSLLGAIAGAAVGETAANTYEAVWGRKSQHAAEEKLKDEGRFSKISLEKLNDIDAAREKLAIKADELTLIKRKQLIHALTALGVGASAAITLAEFASVQQAAETAVTGDPSDTQHISESLKESKTTISSKTLESEASGSTKSTGIPSNEQGPEVKVTEATPPAKVHAPESVVTEHASKPPQAVPAPRAEAVAPVTEASPSEVIDTPPASSPSPEIMDSPSNSGEPELAATENSPDSMPATPVQAETAIPSETANSVPPLETEAAAPEAPVLPDASIDASEAPTSVQSPENTIVPEAVTEPEPSVSAEGIADSATTAPAESAASTSSEAVVTTPDTTAMADIPEAPEPPGPTVDATEVPAAAPLPSEPVPAPSEAPAPVIDSNPATDRSEITVTGQPIESFTNSYGIEVTPSVPNTYEVKLPGGKGETYIVVYGGTFDERYAAAERYVKLHPGTIVRFDTPLVDPITNQKTSIMGALRSDAEGVVIPDVTDRISIDDSKPLKIPGPNDLVRIVS